MIIILILIVCPPLGILLGLVAAILTSRIFSILFGLLTLLFTIFMIIIEAYFLLWALIPILVLCAIGALINKK